MENNQRIIKYFEDNSLIDPLVIKEYLAKTQVENIDFVEYISNKNLLNPESINNLLAHIYGVEYIELKEINIDTKILSLFNLNFVKKNKIFPYRKNFRVLEIAMEDPSNYELIHLIRQKIGFFIRPALSTKKDIEDSIKKYSVFFLGMKTKSISPKANSKNIDQSSVSNNEHIEEIDALLEEILQHSLEENAFEVSFEPGYKNLGIYFKKEKSKKEFLVIPGRYSKDILNRIANLDKESVLNNILNKTGYKSLGSHNHLTFDFKTTFAGEKAQIKFPEIGKNPNLEGLALQDYDKNILSERLNKNEQGLILVIGPNNSGKSKTLYSLIGSLDNNKKNITTVEDSIKFNLPGVHQTEIHEESVDDRLTNILNQGTDAIMVDTKIDKSTAPILIQAAVSGNLILTAFPLSKIMDCITFLKTSDIKDFLISASLNLIINQRSIPKLCPVCKEKVIISEGDKKELSTLFSEDSSSYLETKGLDTLELYEPRGCVFCDKTGYKGTVTLLEFLWVNTKIEEFIEDGSWDIVKNDLEDYIKKQARPSLVDNGLSKVLHGDTSLEALLTIL